MAEAAALNTQENDGEKPKKHQIRRGRVIPVFNNPVLQARALKSMQEHRFGKKSAQYQMKNDPKKDSSDVSSFTFQDVTDSFLKDDSSADTEGDDTIHDTVWKKREQARRHHKNYQSPVSFDLKDDTHSAKSMKSFNATAEKSHEDSILPPSEIKRRQALRRRQYHSPESFVIKETDESIGEKENESTLSKSKGKRQQPSRKGKMVGYASPTSYDGPVDKENMEAVMKEVKPNIRRETLAAARDYSAILRGLGNTTDRSSKNFDSSKRSSDMSKLSEQASKKFEISKKVDVLESKVTRSKLTASRNKSTILNDEGLEISAILDSNSDKKKAHRPRALLAAEEDEATENLKAMGLPAVNSKWKEIVTSTPLAAKPPSGSLVAPSSNDLAAAQREVFKFDGLPEASNDDTGIENVVEQEANNTLVESNEDGRREDTLSHEPSFGAAAEAGVPYMVGKDNMSDGAIVANVPETEATLPNESAAIVSDRSMSANDLSARMNQLFESAVPEQAAAPAVRSAPASPIALRRSKRNAKPKPVCRMCDPDSRHFY